MDLFLRKNHLLRCWDYLSILNWIGALTLPLLLKLPSRKSKPYFILWNFFLLRLHLSSSLAWNTIVMSELVLLVATLDIPLVNVHMNWLNWFQFLILKGGLLDSCMIFVVTIPRCCKAVYVNSFFLRTAKLWNSLPIECFPRSMT